MFVPTSIDVYQILRSLCSWSGGVPPENSIHEAYIKAIEASQHFIYIEVIKKKIRGKFQGFFRVYNSEDIYIKI